MEEDGYSPYQVTGAPAPDLELQISSKYDFSSLERGVFLLDPSTYTFINRFDVFDEAAKGIYVRWKGDHSIWAQAGVPGRCPPPPPTPTPVPSPTPVPTIGDQGLADVCKGTRLPLADAYAGTVHPLVAAFGPGAGGTSWDLSSHLPWAINDKWYGGLWPSPIQLVVCVDQAFKKLSSCGTYQSDSGKKGQLIPYRFSAPIRVVVARTGKVIASKTIYGATPHCPGTFKPFSNGPPWKLYGPQPDDDAINAYATSFSTGAVK
jgi:hypothetical protein